MGKILTLGCKVKPRGVPKIWPISETGRALIKFMDNRRRKNEWHNMKMNEYNFDLEWNSGEDWVSLPQNRIRKIH